MANAYENNSSYSFEGEVEEIDVEQAIEDSAGGIPFDPYRLTEVLMEIGQKMTGIFLYEYQEPVVFRIIYSILNRDGAEITALFSRQSGKSEAVVFSTVTLSIILPVLAKIYPKELGHFSHGIKMGLLAPQMEQVETVYARCMERLQSDSVKEFLDDPDINDNTLSTVKFKLKSGSFLTGQSAAKQAKVESKTYNIIFLDESQDMDTEKVRRSIIPMTASTFGTIVRTGTPGRNKGDFYHTIQNNKKHDAKLQTPRKKRTEQLHFEYDYEKVISAKKKAYNKDKKDFHLLYEKAVMRDKQSMKENSDYFRMAYKIEWLLEVGMFITDTKLDELCMERKRTFPQINQGDFVVAGLDIASARAETVLTIGLVDNPAKEFGEKPVKTIADWLALHDTNYEVQFHIVAEHLLAKQVKVLYVDCTGVGRHLSDTLIYHLGDMIDIVPYLFTPSSKSDMWKTLEEDIENGCIKVPASKTVRDKKEFKAFEEQMTNLQKFWRGSYMVCEKVSGFKDDYCDSLGLMNLAGNHLYLPPSEIEVSDNVLLPMGRGNIHRQSKW